MAEYIEKEKVIERIDLSIKSWSADYNSNSPNMVRAYKDVKSRLESIPAADVAPVVHGRWIEDGGYQVCSNCGEEHHWDEYRAAYCEGCGAKMDGERRESE